MKLSEAISVMVAVKVSLLLSFNTNANNTVKPPRRTRRKTADLRVHTVKMKDRAVAFLQEQGA
jgi:hypothetical protein